MDASLELTTDDTFEDLGLNDAVLAGIRKVGYEKPSPIQSVTIPHVLSGRDVLGQAQTGTGKTAAFALPILCNLNLKQRRPQVLVLAPTRELAIQVAEAFQRYAAKLEGFAVLPVYGGQEYSGQLRSLKRGVHVVVGTPGRVIDHIKRGTLDLKSLMTLVLDEADEMLRMGFIEDVEWILERTPKQRQIALFSATMPPAVRRIAEQYLRSPEVLRIDSTMTTADTVQQRYWLVKKVHKLDALTRVLDAEPFDASIIFVRTKSATLELAERLKARGFSAEALNGDIPQAQRERTVQRLKNGAVDILVATDVAARGLDVERITHVVNYDIPFDAESYVHRIGRTGRAGRVGQAILFVSPREQRMLSTIKRQVKSSIEEMELPTKQDAARKRREEFKERVRETLTEGRLGLFNEIVTEFVEESGVPIEDVAAALAKLAQGDRPLIVTESKPRKGEFSERRREARGFGSKNSRSFKERRRRDAGAAGDSRKKGKDKKKKDGAKRNFKRPLRRKSAKRIAAASEQS